MDEVNRFSAGMFGYLIVGILVLGVFPMSICKVSFSKGSLDDSSPFFHKYHEPGDSILGGIISHSFVVSETITFTRHPFEDLSAAFILLTQTYQHILALVFAVKEINGNPQILTNVTLGFNIYNNYFNPKLTYEATMKILSTPDRFIPNYKCDFQNNLVAVIGGPNSNDFFYIATILSQYKIAQVVFVHGRGKKNLKKSVTIPLLVKYET
ncbi:vomeronasal type-2 receptor 26-like [Pantherophis guttatus]|uniref:Vomeronasal type-2 receptor 26-like n=1 Tax=Pantherophis guttatus TaxID=94885 RepID=A0A6P9AWE6_PANGU|nr:vomeronasal type-2 receptor 26-like [Pantherophis guttatus]